MLLRSISAAVLSASVLALLAFAPTAKAASPEFQSCIEMAAASRQTTIEANPKARDIADAEYLKDIDRCQSEEAARKIKSGEKDGGCYPRKGDGNDKPPAGTIGGSGRR